MSTQYTLTQKASMKISSMVGSESTTLERMMRR